MITWRAFGIGKDYILDPESESVGSSSEFMLAVGITVRLG